MTKDEFKDRVDKDTDELKSRLNDYHSKADNLSGNQKTQTQRDLTVADQQLKTLQANVDKLDKASDKTWVQFRAVIQRDLDKLRNRLDQIGSRF